MGIEQLIELTLFFLLISTAMFLLFMGALFCTWRRIYLRIFSFLLFLFIYYLIKLIMDWSNYYYWTYFSVITILPSFSLTYMFKKKEIKEKNK